MVLHFHMYDKGDKKELERIIYSLYLYHLRYLFISFNFPQIIYSSQLKTSQYLDQLMDVLQAELIH